MKDPPTLAPTVKSDYWKQTGTLFDNRNDAAGYGSIVSIGINSMAVGAPFTLDNGAVFIYEKDSNDIWQTTSTTQLFGEIPGGKFGTSIDMTDSIIVVGAPSTFAEGTLTEVGAAYCYAKDSNEWIKLGTNLRGDPGIYGANENFGYSVAISKNYHLIVGAPTSSLDLNFDKGRIYAFLYDSTKMDWELIYDEVGYVNSSQFGTSVDISEDGSHFIVGAPGAGNGYASVYKFNDGNWTSVTMVQGSEKGEGFGSSVKILVADGSVIAIGAPYYQKDKGKVTIYENIDGNYQQLGLPIIGNTGEYLGAENMVTGGSYSTLSIIVGTAFGYVQKYDYIKSSKEWQKQGEEVATGYFTTFSSVVSSLTSETFVVGGENDTSVYELN